VLGGPGGNNLATTVSALRHMVCLVEPRASNCKPSARERKRFQQRCSREVQPGRPNRIPEETSGGKKRVNVMKKMFALGFALLLSTSLFAATSGSMKLSQPVQLNGTQIKPGDYKVTWEGTGPEVTVSVLKGKEVIAKTSARLKELDKNGASDATVLQKNADGSTSLNGIRFGGKKVALEFAEETAAAGMKSGTSSN